MYEKITLKKYLDMIADSTPTPGGGSVSAYTAALSSALGVMTTGIAIKKSYLKKGKEKTGLNTLKLLRSARNNFKRNYTKLLKLAEKDSQAYDRVSEAYKLPHYALNRRKKINQALQHAAEVPYEVMALCQQNLMDMFQIRNLLPGNILSDISVAVLLAKTAYYGARLNVVINIESIKDEKLTKKLEKKVDSLEKIFSYILSGVEGWL